MDTLSVKKIAVESAMCLANDPHSSYVTTSVMDLFRNQAAYMCTKCETELTTYENIYG